MDLTPLDMAKARFSKSFRGFKPHEVEEFCQKASEALENALTQAENYKREISRLREMLEQFSEMESTLQNTLVMAQKTADQVIANAKKEAELIIRDSELRGRAIQEEFGKIKADREQFEIDFAALLESYLMRLGRNAGREKAPGPGKPEIPESWYSDTHKEQAPDGE